MLCLQQILLRPLNMSYIKLLILSLLITSCQSNENNKKTEEIIKVILQDTISFNQSEQVLKALNTSSHWSIDFEYFGAQKDWCRVVNQSGNSARIEYSENLSIEAREVTIIVRNGTQVAKTDITQLGTPISDKVNEWLELPETAPKSGELFVSHYMTLQKKYQRDYSMLFDKQKRIAYWVAYPLHKGLLINMDVDRTDVWKSDPKIPKQNQLSSTISDYQPAYHRGHQIPSADRLCSEEANKQTFFYSNATPQRATFNQGIWLRLESMVRDYANHCDTLYIVTGAILQTVNGNEKIKYVADKNKIRVAVPNYYYKVLLRLRGTTYDAIGFWFEHKEGYPNSRPTQNDMKSIDAIEGLTGYDFFKSLPKDIQNRVESEFKPNRW